MLQYHLDLFSPHCCDVVIRVKIVLLMKAFKLVHIMKPCLKYCKIVLFLFVLLVNNHAVSKCGYIYP